MEIKKLTILGKSDAVISMILDNLESCEFFPKIKIYNNLNLPKIYEFVNPKFDIEIINSIEDSDFFSLGVFKSNNKYSIQQNHKIPIERFIKIVHKSSQISSTTNIGFGNIINCLVSIAGHTSLGNFVTINRSSSVGHHTTIGDFCTIHPGVNIAGHVTIGNNTTIGIGSNVFDGIKIGQNSVIGGGSVVTKDIPDNVIAFGNPCKIIKKNE